MPSWASDDGGVWREVHPEFFPSVWLFCTQLLGHCKKKATKKFSLQGNERKFVACKLTRFIFEHQFAWLAIDFQSINVERWSKKYKKKVNPIQSWGASNKTLTPFVPEWLMALALGGLKLVGWTTVNLICDIPRLRMDAGN